MNKFSKIFNQTFFYHWLPIIVVFTVMNFIGWYKTNNGFFNFVLWIILSSMLSYVVIAFMNSEWVRLFLMNYNIGEEESKTKYYLRYTKYKVRKIISRFKKD